MEQNNLSNKLKEINASIEKLEKKERMIKDVFQKDILNTSEYYNKKIRKLEEEKRKKLSEIHIKEDSEILKIKEEREPFYNQKEEIKRTFKLLSIKENLNENVEIKLSTWGDPEPNEKEENLDLMKIGSFIIENRNKPVNKYDLIIKLIFKNPKLEDFIKTKCWDNKVLEKSFKTIEEAQNYLNKNYDRVLLEFKKSHDEVLEQLKEINIDLEKEFDFNLIKAYSHKWKLEQKEKNKAVFIGSYNEEETFEVEYLGNRKFKISNQEEKRELELSLEYSIYNFTPEIISN